MRSTHAHKAASVLAECYQIYRQQNSALKSGNLPARLLCEWRAHAIAPVNCVVCAEDLFMTMTTRATALAPAFATPLATLSLPAAAIAQEKIKIGVVTTLSGPSAVWASTCAMASSLV
jgi:hypothetical protein